MSLAITPFEKNVEVWRQLWRVIERSHLLLQIVDARNPAFFYARDLDLYIKEVGKSDRASDHSPEQPGENDSKKFVLLINKADFLTQELRQHWSDYFKEKKVNHIFFSALYEQSRIDAEDESESDASDSE